MEVSGGWEEMVGAPQEGVVLGGAPLPLVRPELESRRLLKREVAGAAAQAALGAFLVRHGDVLQVYVALTVKGDTFAQSTCS